MGTALLNVITDLRLVVLMVVLSQLIAIASAMA